MFPISFGIIFIIGSFSIEILVLISTSFFLYIGIYAFELFQNEPLLNGKVFGEGFSSFKINPFFFSNFSNSSNLLKSTSAPFKELHKVSKALTKFFISSDKIDFLDFLKVIYISYK